jgi:hypothetical protein
MKSQIADGLPQGLVTIALWHVISEESGSAAGLEEVCRFIRENQLPVMLMADAVKAVQNPRKHFDRYVEQMPNPRFSRDLDRNNRPDGYFRSAYAPPEAGSNEDGRVAEFSSGTFTWIYGPESGKTRLLLTVRSADGAPRTITPLLDLAEIDAHHAYRWHKNQRYDSVTVGKEWQTAAFPLSIAASMDRIKIVFEVSPPGKVYVRKASWRLAPE